MKNSILLGVLCSLLVTCFGIALVYVLRYQPQNMSVGEFINDVLHSNQKQSAILSLSLLANIPLIYFNQKRKLMKTIYGIAAVIFPICILIVLTRFNLLHLV
jgi:ABC-type spermidine/putrescine transport system permease subunit II